MKRMILYISLTLLAISCSEETLTTAPGSEAGSIAGQESFALSNCANMRLDKPKVDLLFVVDNSGSTQQSNFQAVKGQISNTINTVSNEFDYRAAIIPLIYNSSYPKYPVVTNEGYTGIDGSKVTFVSADDINGQFFAPVSGSNTENGFNRVYDMLSQNSAGVFRQGAHKIIVMISNGDDTSVYQQYPNHQFIDENQLSYQYNRLLSLKSTYDSASLRFISLVDNSGCFIPRQAQAYIRMSGLIYNSDSQNNDDSSARPDSKDLCSGNYATLFSSINNSIRSVTVGYSYDHWLISTSGAGSIQENDISLSKILADGSQQSIPANSLNGFEYLGYQNQINTRYAPTIGEPVTGLVVRLNGSARLDFPECIVAQTKSPIEYIGYAVIQRKPVESSIIVKKNGVDVPAGGANGWSYEGYFDSKNVKVQYNNVSNQPGIFKSGYFIRLNGTSVLANGDTYQVFFTPAAI